MPQLSPQQFVDKWKRSELKESAASQEHFIDLCRLLNHPTPAEADHTGEAFTFEKGATKQRGGQGWADVWKKGYFAWEYKGKHKDLDAAYQQLLQYRESLLNPPLLVVSDMEQIIVHPNFVNRANQPVAIALEDLLTTEGLKTLRAIFYAPDTFQAPQTIEQVTEEAAAQFAHLAELLRRYGADPQEAAHFLIRLLFCLFAEDVELLPQGLFTQLVKNMKFDPPKFMKQLQQLFGAMAEGGGFGFSVIAHFDGKLFDDDAVLQLDSDSLDILARVCDLDWSSIEPSIFGTLFERSLDPSKRSQLGAHYTSKEDILLIVEPVLMAPLRRRWDEVKEEARDLARKRDETDDRGVRTRRQNALASLLLSFATELTQVQVLDPACGSGNFLYVALRQLLDLWKEASVLASDLGLPLMLPDIAPTPEQLHGIEINLYAHQLAQATIWIGYIQWLRENGFGQPSEPILKPLDNILLMDAILAYDEQGNPVEPAWPAADVIIGNPPFLGGNKIRQELGDQYVDTLFKLYDERVPAFADLVCYWFERARAEIKMDRAKRAGLLATNSIRGGANRRILERIKESGDIFWAQSDRDWILEGAAVNVSMVGFDDGSEDSRLLDDQLVEEINADLTATVDLTKATKLEENRGLCFMGPSPKAPFDIDWDIAQELLSAPPNTHGRPNSDVVRPVASAIDLVRRSRNKWTIDFGTMSLEEASLYEAPFEYVKQHILPVRKTRRDDYRGQWWQYARPRPEMREALKGLPRYIATPAVSKHRVFVWMRPEVLCNQGNLVFAFDHEYYFGVLHSKMHELWALRQGTSLEDRPRYTPTTTFETFPFPWPPGREPEGDTRVEAIAEAARELVERRDVWLNPPGTSEKKLKKRTLTNLYNEYPTWLKILHDKLDQAVLDAYGWPHNLTDDQILERLLELNLERGRDRGRVEG